VRFFKPHENIKNAPRKSSTSDRESLRKIQMRGNNSASQSSAAKELIFITAPFNISMHINAFIILEIPQTYMTNLYFERGTQYNTVNFSSRDKHHISTTNHKCMVLILNMYIHIFHNLCFYKFIMGSSNLPVMRVL
jgi:hypothetical protein